MMKQLTWTISLLSVAAVTAGLANAAPAPTPQDRGQPTASEVERTINDRSIRIHRLSYTSADEVAGIVARVINTRPGETCAVDSRTNALIVAAMPDSHEKIDALIAELDRPVEPEPEDRPVRILRVQHTPALAVVNTLNRMMNPQRITFGYDEATNSVIARGFEDELKMTENLIASLDVPSNRKTDGEQVTLRICWLANGVEGLKNIPADLRDVTRELESVGVEGLGLVAQTFTQVTTGSEFNSQFTAMLEHAWDVNIEGRARSSGSDYVLDLGVNARSRVVEGASAGNRTHAQSMLNDSVFIETMIATPGGHSVVLGMTPIRDKDSVFVVQILSE